MAGALIATTAISLFEVRQKPATRTPAAADKILVEKSAHRLTLFCSGRKLKEYRIALGFSPVGPKQREGDGRTPTGSYGFGSFFFGVNSRPSGIRYAWRHAYTYDVWDDDSSSARYNLWTNRNRHYPGRGPEPMHVSPAYNYGAVIAYNTARKPGLGSAIFLHVSHGSSTAGCVAVPQADLLKLLRWLNPKLSPRIIMGTTSAITK